MIIERATVAHQADAHALLNEYYEAIAVVERDTPQAIQHFLSEPDAGMWIAYVDGAPAGCVILRPLAARTAAGECKRLYVRPACRGQGVAEALLDAMEADAVARGLDWIYLDTNDSLVSALRLYARRAYQPCERYNDNPQATVFLRKALRA